MCESRDERRLEIATKIFNVDAQLTAHFETVRVTFLGFVVTLTGIVLVFADKKSALNDSAAFLFLLGFSFIALFASWRFSHAAHFHWRLTAKMRQIIAKHDSKVFEKYHEISKMHSKRKPLRQLSTDAVWVLLTFAVPLLGALLLWYVRA